MRLRLPAALFAVLAFFAGCATGPRTAPAPLPAPAVFAPAVPLDSFWLVTETWDPFVQTGLGPQEWALRHWHVWKLVSGSLDLKPLIPLPSVPVFRSVDLGGDPRVWQVDYREPAPEPASSTATIREVDFLSADTQGLPPSVYALRRVLPTLGTPSGQVRVDEVTYDRGRFKVRLELQNRSH